MPGFKDRNLSLLNKRGTGGLEHLKSGGKQPLAWKQYYTTVTGAVGIAHKTS